MAKKSWKEALNKVTKNVFWKEEKTIIFGRKEEKKESLSLEI